MNCAELTARLDEYLDGDLDAPARDACAAHLADCETCAARVSKARSLLEALADHPIVPSSPGFADRAIAAARSSGGIPPAAPRRAPRLIAGGFLLAFAASIFTVIYTGLLVEAPRTRISAGLPTVSMSVAETRVVNLVFSSATALGAVSLQVDLPEGVDLRGYEGMRRVSWHTELQAGRNVLPLELVAREPVEGQLIASLEHADQRKIFRVFLEAGPG